MGFYGSSGLLHNRKMVIELPCRSLAVDINMSLNSIVDKGRPIKTHIFQGVCHTSHARKIYNFSVHLQ